MAKKQSYISVKWDNGQEDFGTIDHMGTESAPIRRHYIVMQVNSDAANSLEFEKREGQEHWNFVGDKDNKVILTIE